MHAQVERLLTEHGLSCFLYTESLPQSQKELDARVKSSKHFVMLITAGVFPSLSPRRNASAPLSACAAVFQAPEALACVAEYLDDLISPGSTCLAEVCTPRVLCHELC